MRTRAKSSPIRAYRATCKLIFVLLWGIWVFGVAGGGCQAQKMPQEGVVRPDASQQDATQDEAPEASHIELPAETVGATCQHQDDCGAALECETRIPRGYCTKGCTSSTQCPSKSACVKIKFQDGTAFLRCLRTCFENADCRKGFYCYHPPGAWKLICLPNEAKPQP